MDRTMTIRGRLYLGFGIIIAILMIATLISSTRIGVIKTTVDMWYKDALLYDTTTDLNMQLYRFQAAATVAVYENQQESILKAENELMSIGQTAATINKYMNNNPDLIPQWQQISRLLDNLILYKGKLANNDNITNKTLFEQELLPTLTTIFPLLDNQMGNNKNGGNLGLLQRELHSFDLHSNEANRNIAVIEKTIYILLVISILFSIVIVYFTTRSIVNYIQLIRHHSNRIANGDLTQRLNAATKDEMGALSEDLNKMTDSLVKMTKLINESTHNMVSSLAEVKQSASFQSSGASEQATSINEITASLAEIEKSSTQTNEKAKSLGENAERTRARGQQGLESVEQSINGMKVVRDKVQAIAQTILELSKQTQQVGEITTVVNNLAQQSKMLALNASIEAVKAGEAGKGFSVVANEVKNLAEQSEQSTAQVQKILENIRHTAEKAVMVTEEGTKEVDIGTRLVEQTGEVVKSLTEVIYDTSIATQQIEAAIRQENVGIEQITIGMNEINQVTSSFVASTKQTMEAIENLSQIAKNIKEYIDSYKL